MSLTDLRHKLGQIEQSLDDGTYRAGMWQRFILLLNHIDNNDLDWLKTDLTRVSNKLHARHGYPEAPAWAGFLFEYALLCLALLLAFQDSLVLRLVSVALLAVSLQPLIKVSVGLLLGVRYAYVYLWYFEPRFKMQFGTYFLLPAWKKVLMQFSGSIGTPIALFAGWVLLADVELLSLLCLAGAALAALMQVAAFVAAWFGVRRVGTFYLPYLTTPAQLAIELRGAKK